MKIAYIGQKGVPATWGGIEFHVDELASRLVKRGHQVTVYVRNWYTPKETSEYQGIRLVHTLTWNTKHLDAIIHSLTSSIHALFQNYDIIHYHAIGPAFFCWLPKLFGKRVVVTIHRFDYMAAKWSGFAQYSLRFAEKIALRVPNRTIVVARHQQDHYSVQGYTYLKYIPNGVPILTAIRPEIIRQKYGLGKNQYLFFAGRLTPEKRVDWLLQAYHNLNEEFKSKFKLVIAGGSSATDIYEKNLHRDAKSDSGIIFTGYVQGQEKQELFSNAKLFILPSEVEGLPIALLEGMSFGLPCLASDIPPHREVIQNNRNGYLFAQDSITDLQNKLENILAKSDSELAQIGIEAKQKVASDYNWNDLVVQTEQVYAELIRI
jgi:glycosyltransferase involved in cell wall biosynthesis